MQKSFLQFAAFMGALAVGLGAFGAHGLKKIFTPDILQTWETAVKYQFYHVFALLAAGLLYAVFSNSRIIWAGRLFIAGMLIFPGSLYLLCFAKNGQWGMDWIGAVTPLGGVAFIAGWLLLLLGVSKKN